MTKRLYVMLIALFLVAALCFTACSGGNNGGKFNMWNGVDGDEVEFTLGNLGTVAFNRDGSCYVYEVYDETITGTDVGKPELVGEVSMYPTSYGTYQASEEKITVTLEAQVYYRFVATGKDATALKDAVFEVSFSGNEEYREDYYGKGIIRSERNGTMVIECNLSNENCTMVSLASYDEDNVKVSDIIYNADGSYKETEYYDGTIESVSEYDSKENIIKREVYNEDGTIDYTENFVREENRTITTRTDASGNVIRTKEDYQIKYENNGYYQENTVIENGVTISHNIAVMKYDENGFSICSYSLFEEVDGNRTIRNESYEDYRDGRNNYTSSTETIDGVLNYYYCSIQKITLVEGVEDGYQSVKYERETGKYTLDLTYTTPLGEFVSVGYEYSADEYVHGEWENFEYVAE